MSVNQIHLDRLALGLRACDTSGISANIADIATGCVPVNMFNPLTPAMTDYIRSEQSLDQIDVTWSLAGSENASI